MQQIPLSARTSAPPSVRRNRESHHQLRSEERKEKERKVEKRTENKLIGNRIPQHRRRQSNSRRTPSSRVHTSRRNLRDVLEELRLGHSRVSHEADVDVSSNLHPVPNALRHSSHEKKEKSALDVFVSEDLGRNRTREPGEKSRHALEFLNLASDLGRKLHRLVLLLELLNVVSFEVRIGEETDSHRLHALVRDREEDAADVDDIAGRDGTRLVAVEVDDHRAGDVTDRDLIRLRGEGRRREEEKDGKVRSSSGKTRERGREERRTIS
jgi:hypothetical protein